MYLEKALQHSDQILPYQMLFEAMPGAFLVLTADSEIIWASDEYLRFAEKKRDTILGSRFSDFIPQKDIEVSFRETIEKKASSSRIFQKNGTSWKSLHSPVLDSKGEVKYIVHSVQQLSEAGSSSKPEFVGTGEGFQMLVESIQNYAIYMINVDGIVTSWNAGAHHIKKYSASEILGKHFSVFYPSEDVQKGIPEANLAMAEQQGRYVEEGWRVRKDGSRFWASVVITALRDKDGRLCGFVKVTGDITERKHGEEKLKNLNADLERQIKERTNALEKSNSELEQFAYVASHDLQEPLRTISSWAQLLKRDFSSNLPDEAKTYIDFIVDGSQRMTHLVRDLLNFSRLSTVKSKLESVDMQEVIRVSLENLQKTIIENKADVSVPAGLPTLWVDKSKFVQLFQNLIGNAIKFKGRNDPKISISFSFEQKDDVFAFCVADNGIGIDPKFSDRIFEIFKRLHTRDEYPGSGIGLSLSKKIVEQRGGRIWVESKLGQGSKFYFTVPVTYGNNQFGSAET